MRASAAGAIAAFDRGPRRGRRSGRTVLTIGTAAASVADGRDVSAASGLTSSTFVLGADGTVPGVVPEPRTLALTTAGAVAVLVVRRRVAPGRGR